MDDASNLRLSSLRAVVQTHHADLLLPTAPVDVRVRHARFFDLSGSSLIQLPSLEPLVRFLRDSDLQPDPGPIAARKMLTPPLVASLGLPRRLFHPFADAALSHDDATNLVQEDEEQDLLTLDYQFAGLEKHHLAVADWEGYPLVYTAVEAPMRGCERFATLSLEKAPLPRPRPRPRPTPPTAPHQQEEQEQPVRPNDTLGELPQCTFLEAVAKVAQGDTLKWQTRLN